MIIGMIPAAAGGGTTTLAIAVAAQLGARGQRVALIDADPTAALSRRLGISPPRPLGDLFGWREDEASRPGGSTPLPNVRVIAADGGRFAGGGVSFAPRALERCLRAIEPECDRVLVDLPPPGTPALATALEHLDAVVLVVPATSVGAREVPGALRMFLSAQRDGSPRPTLRAVVVTPVRDADPSVRVARAVARACSGGVPSIVVPYTTAIEDAAIEGLPFSVPAGTFGDAIAMLARTILLPSSTRTARDRNGLRTATAGELRS